MLIRRVARRLKRLLSDDPDSVLQQQILQAVEQVFIPDQALVGEIDLPPQYGRGLPERAVELLLARATYKSGARVLDVGYANAMNCHLRMIRQLAPTANIIGIDLALPVYDTTAFYAGGVCADMTRAPLAASSFDIIWCISTLEHIGMDNSGYTTNFRRDASMAQEALREMLRLLVTGGRLLITVPYGRYEDHGWLINYDCTTWQTLLDIARPEAKIREWYFRHTFGDGWKSVSPQDLEHVGYLDQANCGAGGVAAALITKHALC